MFIVQDQSSDVPPVVIQGGTLSNYVSTVTNGVRQGGILLIGVVSNVQYYSTKVYISCTLFYSCSEPVQIWLDNGKAPLLLLHHATS